MAMRQATVSLAWLLPLAALLAGCVGDSGENAKLNHKGDDIGSHEDSADCDDDGTLSASGDIEDGQVEVIVTDGSGNEIYSEQLEGDFDVDAEELDGEKGEWTLSATRLPDSILGGFNGTYQILMTC